MYLYMDTWPVSPGRKCENAKMSSAPPLSSVIFPFNSLFIASHCTYVHGHSEAWLDTARFSLKGVLRLRRRSAR